VTKILVVEDDRATAGLLKTIFELEGFKTLVCAAPECVVPTVRQDVPDVIFMDYHLAETDSLSLLREIKADESLRAIPVVMTSGLDHSKECKQEGADGFLIKPFRPAILIAEIRAVLERRNNTKHDDQKT
jgi:DNA-binding response OmpR family regulator